MSYRIKCNHCNAVSINGKACHESGCQGIFVFTKRNRSYAQYKVWSLDVWGNARDGFEVNDRSNIGTILVPEDCADKTIIKAFKDKEWLSRRIRFKSIDIDGDENHIDLSWRKTSEPIYQLERI